MPRPIADWRNAAEYPKRGAHLAPNRWAWEFLRRNPGYQDAWHSFQETVATILADNGGNESQIEYDPRFRHYEPERMAGEDEGAWLARVKRGKSTPIDTWIAKGWGLDGCHPILPGPFGKPFFVSFSSGAKVQSPGQWQTATPAVMQPEMAFVIDFRKPIDGQIESLRRYAESHQKWLIGQGAIEKPETRNARILEWPTYLRLLDAELDGITNADEIAPLLYKGQHTGRRVNDHDSLRRRINKNQREARLLRDGGYLWIAATAPKRRNNSRSKNGSVT